MKFLRSLNCPLLGRVVLPFISYWTKLEAALYWTIWITSIFMEKKTGCSLEKQYREGEGRELAWIEGEGADREHMEAESVGNWDCIVRQLNGKEGELCSHRPESWTAISFDFAEDCLRPYSRLLQTDVRKVMAEIIIRKAISFSILLHLPNTFTFNSLAPITAYSEVRDTGCWFAPWSLHVSNWNPEGLISVLLDRTWSTADR